MAAASGSRKSMGRPVARYTTPNKSEADDEPGGVPEQRQVDRLGHDDREETEVGIAHRLERGELGQPLADVGEEDLVADRKADDESHDHADGEHRPDRGDVVPEPLLPGDQALPW